ncbi:DUF6308 family protein [Corynebacterium variabile]|uniref:DUF6308 family protein n=1 Tax=Corynebacterium variabile TaxID=1727 RepID=UPI003F94A0D5
MSNSEAAQTVWGKVGWAAPAILAEGRVGEAARQLAAYFRKLDLETCDYMTGASFSDLGGGGDRPEVANVITAEDIVAVESLSVTFRRIHQLQLLGAGVTESGRAASRSWINSVPLEQKLRSRDYPNAVEVPIDSQAVTAALARIPNGVDLAELTDDEKTDVMQDVDWVWREMRRAHLGQTMVSKLLARKRPKLLPIIDSAVKKRLFQASGKATRKARNIGFYRSMWEVMSDPDLALPSHLSDIRERAFDVSGDARITRLSDLRVFDIVVWMDVKYPST